MEALIRMNRGNGRGATIELSGAPLEKPHVIRLGVSGPGFVLLGTADWGKGYFIAQREYAKVPEAARRLLKEGIPARAGRRNLVIQVLNT